MRVKTARTRAPWKKFHSMLTTWLLWCKLIPLSTYPLAIFCRLARSSIVIVVVLSIYSEFQLIKKFCKNSDCIISLQWRRGALLLLGLLDFIFTTLLGCSAAYFLKLCHFAFIGRLSKQAAAQCVKLRGWLRVRAFHIASVSIVCGRRRLLWVASSWTFLHFENEIFWFQLFFLSVLLHRLMESRKQEKTFEINSTLFVWLFFFNNFI